MFGACIHEFFFGFKIFFMTSETLSSGVLNYVKARDE